MSVGTILKYNDTLNIDYRSIKDWTCVADGVWFEIGIVLRVARSDLLLAYTPDTFTSPDNPSDPDHPYPQNVYTSGNIFITTEGQTIWVKPPNQNFPATISGEIVYNLGYNIEPGSLYAPHDRLAFYATEDRTTLYIGGGS